MTETTRDPAEIERELHETREAIGSTVEELGERLAPSHLVEDAKTYMKETAMRGANSLFESVRGNALPLGLIGGGLLLLMRSDGSRREQWGYEGYGEGPMRSRGARPYARTSEPARPLAGRVREAAAEMGESAKEATTQMAESARENIETLRDSAQQKLERMSEEQPFLLGITSLALGAFVGGLLPVTRKEDELLGPMRDQVVETAAETATEQARRATEDAQRERGRGNGGERTRQEPPQPR